MENSLLSDRGRIPLRMSRLYRDNYRKQDNSGQFGAKQLQHSQFKFYDLTEL